MRIIDVNEVKKRRVKDTKYEEPSVTYNSNIKAPGYFKLFECSKTFFNNMDATYKCAWMANEKKKYWAKMYDTITNYNDQNHIPLSNKKLEKRSIK